MLKPVYEMSRLFSEKSILGPAVSTLLYKVIGGGVLALGLAWLLSPETELLSGPPPPPSRAISSFGIGALTGYLINQDPANIEYVLDVTDLS